MLPVMWQNTTAKSGTFFFKILFSNKTKKNTDVGFKHLFVFVVDNKVKTFSENVHNAKRPVKLKQNSKFQKERTDSSKAGATVRSWFRQANSLTAWIVKKTVIWTMTCFSM